MASGRVSYFAKRKPRQRVQRALSKLQIILRAETGRKSRFLRLRELCRLRFLNQLDIADAALHVESDLVRRFSVSVVGVFTAVFVQADSVNGPDPAGGVSGDSNIFWQANRGLAHSTFHRNI